jgi:hypothetical protein
MKCWCNGGSTGQNFRVPASLISCFRRRCQRLSKVVLELKTSPRFFILGSDSRIVYLRARAHGAEARP